MVNCAAMIERAQMTNRAAPEILVVDDDVAVRKSYRLLFEGEGYAATARFVVSALSSTASSSSTSRSAKSNYAGDAGSLLGESLTVDSSLDEKTEMEKRYSLFTDSANVALYAGDIMKNDVVLQPVINSLALDATCGELAGCIDTETVGKR